MKVTAVSYLNTKPFLYGLLHHPIHKQIDLQLDIPAVGAQKLLNGEVDLGLVPIAILPELKSPYIISDYCIGCDGAVRTVSIFSACPLEEMTHLYLDFHSRTSVQLAQLLLEEYWHCDPILLPAEEGFLEKIGGTAGAVVIGDKTIALEDKFPYTYDLGQAWKAHTGLPFVFAAWVSNKPLPNDFVHDLNEALAAGLAHIPELLYLIPSPDPRFDLGEYFQHYIDYDLNAGKRQALQRFIDYLQQKEEKEKVALNFI